MVYLAQDLKHDRQVAVTVVRPELAAGLGANRLLAEIKITAWLDHPHTLTFIDSGAADGLLYVCAAVRPCRPICLLLAASARYRILYHIL